MQQIKAVIFDLDGVIVHTDKFHYKAWKKLADKLEIPFDEKINNRLRGVSRSESFDIILSGSDLQFSDYEKAALCEEKNETYKNLLSTMTPNDVKPEVIEALLMLKQKGIRLAIGSSSKNARIILKRVGLTDIFDAISDGNNISRSKPHPEVFEKAATMLDINPVNCVVVEDAEAGIEAGRSAGMATIGIGQAAACADKAMTDFSQLVKIVASF